MAKKAAKRGARKPKAGAKKKMSRRIAAPKKKKVVRKPRRAEKKLVLPKGFVRPLSAPLPDPGLAGAHAAAPPPCVCVRTGPEPDAPCLRFWRDDTGQYSIPPGGEVVSCAECRASCK